MISSPAAADGAEALRKVFLRHNDKEPSADRFSTTKMFVWDIIPVHTSSSLLHRRCILFKTERMEQDNRGHKKVTNVSSIVKKM